MLLRHRHFLCRHSIQGHGQGHRSDLFQRAGPWFCFHHHMFDCFLQKKAEYLLADQYSDQGRPSMDMCGVTKSRTAPKLPMAPLPGAWQGFAFREIHFIE
jgi:hypothetical protein